MRHPDRVSPCHRQGGPRRQRCYPGSHSRTVAELMGTSGLPVWGFLPGPARPGLGASQAGHRFSTGQAASLVKGKSHPCQLLPEVSSLTSGSSLTLLRASRGPDRMEKAGAARTRQVLGEEAREGPRYSCEGEDKGVVGDRTAKVIQGAGAPEKHIT